MDERLFNLRLSVCWVITALLVAAALFAFYFLLVEVKRGSIKGEVSKVQFSKEFQLQSSSAGILVLGFALAFGGLLWAVLPKGYSRSPDSFQMSYLGSDVPLLEAPAASAAVVNDATQLQALFADQVTGKRLQLGGKGYVRLDPSTVKVQKGASGAEVQATAVDPASPKGVTYTFVPRYNGTAGKITFAVKGVELDQKSSTDLYFKPLRNAPESPYQNPIYRSEEKGR